MTQACANQLIQDAIMFRFLVFSGQTTMTWQDEIHFTEKMGDGEAFPDSKSANRKFHPKVPDERLGYFSNDPNEGLMYQGTEGWHHKSVDFFDRDARRSGPTNYYVGFWDQGLLKNLLEIQGNLFRVFHHDLDYFIMF